MSKTGNGIVADLRRLLGSAGATDDPERMRRYAGDALGEFRAFGVATRLSASPSAVAFPSDAREVSRILRYAQTHGTPIVPYGGGSGVMGAAAPVQDCIIVSSERMNAVVNISAEDMTAHMQAGVVLEDAARAVSDSGLRFGHDPWSRPVATVGGAISTDGMGYTAARHGSMGAQVLGLEAALADGEIIRTKAVSKASYGASLNSLLIGAEGIFGIITQASLRVLPKPEKRILRIVEFPDFEAGFRAICGMQSEGVTPTMVDYGEEFAADSGGRIEPPAVCLAFEGFRADAETQWAQALAICRRYDGREGDRAEALRFWRTRHEPGWRYKREVLQATNPAQARRRRSSARMDYLHVALPVSQALEYRKRCKRIFAENGVNVREWSVWARPDLFSFLITQADDDDGLDADMGKAVDEALTLAQRLGGSMEYCHGVGVKLAHLIGGESEGGLATLRRIKRAIDPAGTLNPNKMLE